MADSDLHKRVNEIEKFQAAQEVTNDHFGDVIGKINISIESNTAVLNSILRKIQDRTVVEKFVLGCLGIGATIVAIIKGVPFK